MRLRRFTEDGVRRLRDAMGTLVGNVSAKTLGIGQAAPLIVKA